MFRNYATDDLGRIVRVMRKRKLVLKKHTRPPSQRDQAYWIDYYCGILAGNGFPEDLEREPDREIDPDPPAKKPIAKRRGSKRSL